MISDFWGNKRLNAWFWEGRCGFFPGHLSPRTGITLDWSINAGATEAKGMSVSPKAMTAGPSPASVTWSKQRSSLPGFFFCKSRSDIFHTYSSRVVVRGKTVCMVAMSVPAACQGV